MYWRNSLFKFCQKTCLTNEACAEIYRGIPLNFFFNVFESTNYSLQSQTNFCQHEKAVSQAFPFWITNQKISKWSRNLFESALLRSKHLVLCSSYFEHLTTKILCSQQVCYPLKNRKLTTQWKWHGPKSENMCNEKCQNFVVSQYFLFIFRQHVDTGHMHLWLKGIVIWSKIDHFCALPQIDNFGVKTLHSLCTCGSEMFLGTIEHSPPWYTYQNTLYYVYLQFIINSRPYS
jgi:hypothetical protein